MKVVPSLLAEQIDVFMARVRQAERLTDYVQIDLMDGIFVPTQSLLPEEVNGMETSLSFEVHLMVKDPLRAMNGMAHPGLKKVIFHFESEVHSRDFIGTMEGRELGVGLAIKPETEIDACVEAAERVGTLLFLAVNPGRYGSPFLPEVVEKILRARKRFPEKTIAVDGGVSLDNLGKFYEIGVDYVCVGSRIFLKGDPVENYRLFEEKVKELESG